MHLYETFSQEEIQNDKFHLCLARISFQILFKFEKESTHNNIFTNEILSPGKQGKEDSLIT